MKNIVLKATKIAFGTADVTIELGQRGLNHMESVIVNKLDNTQTKSEVRQSRREETNQRLDNMYNAFHAKLAEAKAKREADNTENE